MSYRDGKAQIPPPRRPYAPNIPNRANNYPQNARPGNTGFPTNESASQWPLDNTQSGYDRHKNSSTSNGTTRQQYTFPAPPNQHRIAVPTFQNSPAARDYESSPPQSAAPSRIASSRASTVSSIGAIPDFPLPQLPPAAIPPQRKSQTFGPPPSARRPGPTYLTRDSFVTPIAEESPESTPRRAVFGGGGVASRNSSRSDRDVPSRGRFLIEKGQNDVRHISTRDDATRLIRQASREQKSKPELVISSPQSVPEASQASGFRFPFASPTRSRSSSEYELELEIPQRGPSGSRSRSPLLAPDDGFSSPASDRHFGTLPSMSDKIPSSQRPPRLDLDTVREAEARGSLTSLPDLIRRATKLAANLDRGKTASRFGMLDMFSGPEKLHRDKTDAHSTTGSMSDMLSAFPAPGTTPTLGHLASGNATANQRSNTKKKPGRRCCGMPLWIFIAICLLLVVLTAAAVLVPVFLIVIPQQHQSQRDAASQAALKNCPAFFPCSNRGVSLISNNMCSCICVNGFTGTQCTTGEDPGCTTSDVSDSSKTISNATLGASIPRLLTGSQSNFSIPLNSTSLLSLFAANSLSCTSENALVTFNSKSSVSKRFYIVSEEETMPDKVGDGTPAPTARARMSVAWNERRDSQTVATSAGIVFQQSSTTTATASQTTLLMPSSTPPTTATGHSSSQSQDTLDFARVTVLYLLERTNNLDTAIKAQQSIQDLFLQSNMTGTLTLNFGSLNVTADFASFALNLGNGTVLGGNGNGKGGLKGGAMQVRRNGGLL